MFKVAFSLFSVDNQSACSILDWVLNSQSDFDWVLYKLIGNFQHKKTIPLLTCPIRDYWLVGHFIYQLTCLSINLLYIALFIKFNTCYINLVSGCHDIRFKSWVYNLGSLMQKWSHFALLLWQHTIVIVILQYKPGPPRFARSTILVISTSQLTK